MNRLRKKVTPGQTENNIAVYISNQTKHITHTRTVALCGNPVKRAIRASTYALINTHKNSCTMCMILHICTVCVPVVNAVAIIVSQGVKVVSCPSNLYLIMNMHRNGSR